MCVYVCRLYQYKYYIILYIAFFFVCLSGQLVPLNEERQRRGGHTKQGSETKNKDGLNNSEEERK